MTLTTLKFSDGSTATFNLHAGPRALYNFADRGQVHVQPAYYGCPDRHAVTITLGRAGGDGSGYNLSGLRVGEHLLTGVVMCIGHGFRPSKHLLHPGEFPEALDELVDADPDAHAVAASLLAEIAAHFHSVVNAGR